MIGSVNAVRALASNACDARLFRPAASMVMVTTFLAPPSSKLLFPPLIPGPTAAALEGIEERVKEP